MRSPAAAIAWEFRQHHRWGLTALGAYLFILAAIKLLFFQPGERIAFDDVRTFAFSVVVPLTSTCIYFMAVFSYGLSGDLAARESMYPRRMFTLPVTSAALAGWPMLYGAVAMMLLWAATRLFGAWPIGVDVPVIWPALLGASLMAWTQALTWLPYGLPGLRVIVAVLWLAMIDAVVMVALEFKPSEAVMLALLAPHVPLAYFVARYAVTRARRGDVPDWRFGRTATGASRGGTFPSAGSAQTWFEWRRFGRSLPAMVAILLPFELALLFAFPETPVLVFKILLGVLLTPPFMAAFVAATVGKSPPFFATRPMTTPALVAATLKAALRSTLAAWLLVVIAIPLAVRLSGAAPIVIDWWREAVWFLDVPRAAVAVLLVLLLFILSTWKQLVQSLYIGLTGREWAVKAMVFVTLSLLVVIVPLSEWILTHKGALTTALWNALPEIFAVLVCIKIVMAMFVVTRLHRLLGERALMTGAICWNVALFAIYGVLAWILPAILIPRHLLLLVAILAVPLARVSAAPLALAWNRHR